MLPEIVLRIQMNCLPSAVPLMWSYYFSKEMSDFYEQRLTDHGVRIVKDVTAERLWGLEEQVFIGDGRVKTYRGITLDWPSLYFLYACWIPREFVHRKAGLRSDEVFGVVDYVVVDSSVDLPQGPFYCQCLSWWYTPLAPTPHSFLKFCPYQMVLHYVLLVTLVSFARA